MTRRVSLGWGVLLDHRSRTPMLMCDVFSSKYTATQEAKRFGEPTRVVEVFCEIGHDE